MYQTRCSYSHKQTPDTREEISNDIEDIKILKAEIANLKNENNKKIYILVKVHLKEMNDLREDMDRYKAYASNLIKEKDVELSNSLIVNIGLEQEIKTLKYDLREVKTKHEECDIKTENKIIEAEANAREQGAADKDSKEDDTELKNQETQTCQDCIGRNSETRNYIKTCLEQFLKVKEGKYQCNVCDKLFTVDTSNMDMFSHMIQEHEGKQFMEKNQNMILCLYKHN